MKMKKKKKQKQVKGIQQGGLKSLITREICVHCVLAVVRDFSRLWKYFESICVSICAHWLFRFFNLAKSWIHSIQHNTNTTPETISRKTFSVRVKDFFYCFFRSISFAFASLKLFMICKKSFVQQRCWYIPSYLGTSFFSGC